MTTILTFLLSLSIFLLPKTTRESAELFQDKGEELPEGSCLACSSEQAEKAI